jgi:hypothetical protein
MRERITTVLAKTFPTPPASAGIVFDGDEGRLTETAFLRDFAGTQSSSLFTRRF